MGQRLQLSEEDLDLLNRWLRESVYQETYREGYGYVYRSRHPMTREQIQQSYRSWARGGRGWLASGQGGTGIMALLCWYQHVHRPGSKEWRPAIIIRAALEAARLNKKGASA